MLVCNSAEAVHWPLRISGFGKYLEDQDGIPFPIIGDTAWSIMVEPNQANVIDYLNNRQNKGVTAIIANAIEHYYCDNPPANYYGQVPFSNGMRDWSLTNNNYWNQVDFVLNAAKDRGMVVFLFPAYLGYNGNQEGWHNEILAQKTSVMNNYGKFLGKRYKDQGNIVWVSGGDMNPAAHTGLRARVNGIVSGIKTYDTNHLHTAHSGPRRSAMMDFKRALLNLNTAYEKDCRTFVSKIKIEYERPSSLPLTYIEPQYEGNDLYNGWTPLCLQSQSFAAYLGGCLVGHFYGNHDVLTFTESWVSQMNTDSTFDYANIGKLVKSRAWWRLIPDYNNKVVTSDKGTGVNYKSTARTTDGETIMVWNPTTSHVTVDMTKISGPDAKCWWWNPDNDFSSLIGTFNTTGTRSFTPPGARLVLVLDNAASSLAAPGTTVYSIDKIPPPTDFRIISP